MRSISLLFFIFFFNCLSHASANTHVFIGQQQDGASMKTAFILELLDEDLERSVMYNEDGELFLKADKIMAVPKEALIPFLTRQPNNETIRDEYTLNECPNGHPSRHGDGKCNQRACPHFRGK